MTVSKAKKWKFVGGKICIDFINTVGGRIQQEESNPLNYKILDDKLNNFYDLIDWSNAIGVLNESSLKKINLFISQNEKAAKKIFQRAIDLRESIYRIFISLSEKNKPTQSDIDLLYNECAAARGQQKLSFDSNKFKWSFEQENTKPESIIWYVALSASELLVTEQINKIKQCPGDNCGWLFLDTSKNKSRQWCDMKDCGNVAKVRRFRSKHK